MKALEIMKSLKMRMIAFAVIVVPTFIACDNDDDSESVTPPANIEFDYQNRNEEVIVDQETIDDAKYFSDDLTLEYYSAENSNDDSRPLVLLLSGGGFKIHNEIEKMHEYAQDLAKRGYATAVVKYAINGEGNNADIWIRAIHDVRTAIRFFKHNAETYKIDPDNIFTYGWSTGAQLAFFATSLSQDEFKGFNQDFLKGYIQKGLDWHGWDSESYPNVSADVNANIMCMAYMFEEQIISPDDPGLMLIANEVQHFSSGKIIMGRLNDVGYWTIGPDLMREQALANGYIEGENLELHIIENKGIPQEMTNESAIYDEYFDFENVVDFIYRNIK